MLIPLHKITNTIFKFPSLEKLYLIPSFKRQKQQLKDEEKALDEFQLLLDGKKMGNLTSYMYWGTNDYFDQVITKNKYYYLYSDEIATINSNIQKIQDTLKDCDSIVDLGPGSESSFLKKTLPLIKAIKNLSQYYSVDISNEYAKNAAKLAKKYAPELSTYPIVGDIENLTLPHSFFSSKKRLFLFTGSTLGNFSHEQVDSFLYQISHHMQKSDYLLVTCDTNHEKDSLLKAYNNIYCKNLVLNSLKQIDALLGNKINFRYIKIACDWDEETKVMRNYFISTKTQILQINNSILEIVANKKYNIVNSHKFDTLAIKKQFAKHHFKMLNNFISHKQKMIIYVFKLNKKDMG